MIKKLQLIVGRAVLESGSDDTIQLAKLVYYWHTQLNVIKKDATPEGKEYINDIIKEGDEFLKDQN